MTMDRSRFLVSYDIRDSKRLRGVHKTMKDFGWPMQYSVFICDLDSVELIRLKEQLGQIINHGEDAIAYVNLGPPAQRGRECFSFMGVRTELPVSGPTVI